LGARAREGEGRKKSLVNSLSLEREKAMTILPRGKKSGREGRGGKKTDPSSEGIEIVK